MRFVALLTAALAVPAALAAQGYRVQVDSRVQAVSFRGIELDSVPRADVDSATRTADGFAVVCGPQAAFCSFFRPGTERRGGPWVTTADAALWGLGIEGLSLRATARVATDLGDVNVWPGTEPAVQLLDAYAEYATDRVLVELGRTHVVNRFGFVGFDGARATVRPRPWLGVTGYGGWGLARGVALPVTSPALDPLDDFQPRDRQLVAGGDLRVRLPFVTGRILYQREVDPGIGAFVSERTGVDAQLHPLPGVTVHAGADWDLAHGWMGSAEATVDWTAPERRMGASAGWRRYRPHFPLWTIWGAFSPVPYRARWGSAFFRPLPALEVRVRAERYAYDPAEAATPLVSVEDDGWRWSGSGTWRPLPVLAVNAGLHAEFGPGGSSRGFEGAVTWLHGDRLRVTVHAAELLRPLELRFNESSVFTFGLSGAVRVTDRIRATLDAARYDETRDRPDAGAFDWDQFRLAAGVQLTLGSGIDRTLLPPAILRMPEGSR